MSDKPETNNQKIAKTIMEQLGGNQFFFMVGAKQLVSIENGLSFKFGRNSSKSNIVKIKLMPSDTYEVEFAHLRKVGYEMRYFIDKIYTDAYWEDLTRLFEAHTGMATRR